MSDSRVPTTSAVLVIDMQIGLITGAHHETEVLAAVNLVVGQAREAGVPVIFIQHNHSSFAPLMKNGAGWHIHPDLIRGPDDRAIEKEASDSFYKTGLEPLLESLGASTVVITGMQTEYCVDATCRSALSKDIDVILVADGHTTGPSELS
ncbi:MAG: isochorismatase family protein, partial [Gammaproteobacteria bacterium]|nr:isochorismatase family protein [Gammaproteobacteria bacterium]